MNFNEWLNIFLEEKGVDLTESFELEGPSGVNFFTYKIIVEHMLIAPTHEQEQIRKMITQIDFRNGDILHYFRHLANALVK